jgi:serine/threonine protein kinase
VHRDVKPGNVLLGSEHRAKLADFGIARLLADTARPTRTGHAMGTAAYLAPEQVTGQPVSGSTDVYSLGLVLLEALTGQLEYPGPGTEAALARLHRPPRIPGRQPARPTSPATPDRAARTAAAAARRRQRSHRMTAVLRLCRPRRNRTAGSAATGAVRTLVLLLALLAGAVAGGGCGQDTPPPGEAVPALADRLQRVDAAIEAGNYGQARAAVEALVAETAHAEVAGNLSSQEADRILTAARALLAQLPADPSESPAQEPAPSTDAPEETEQDVDEDKDDDKDEEKQEDGGGKGGGNGPSSENGPDDGHGN